MRHLYHFLLPRKVLLPQSHFHPYILEKLIMRPRSRLSWSFLLKALGKFLSLSSI